MLERQTEGWFIPIPLSSEGEERIEASALALRMLAALGVFIALTSTQRFDRPMDRLVVAMYTVAILVRMFPAFRVIPPRPNGLVFLGVELGATYGAMLATGGWSSAYAIALLSPLFVIGVVYGAIPGAASVAVLAVPLSALAFVRHDPSLGLATVVQVSFLFLAATSLGVLARSLLRTNRRLGLESAAEMERLRRAGALVRELHSLVLKTPESFDLLDSVNNLQAAARAALPYDAIAIYTTDDGEAEFALVKAEGSRPPQLFLKTAIPGALKVVSQANRSMAFITSTFGAVLGASNGYGLYATIRSRESLLGFVVLERRNTPYDTADAEVLDELLLPISFALDNVRWFDRVRDVISETERMRIARDLHDHVAQGLAHVQLELAAAGRANPPVLALPHLQAVVRELLSDVRTTLRDLRQGADSDVDLDNLVSAEVERIEATGQRITFIKKGSFRDLNSAQRRECWMILREAIRNAHMHARSEVIEVGMLQTSDTLKCYVRDHGLGFDASAAPESRFGLVGMRERAHSVGFDLTIESELGRGTEVTLNLTL